MDGNSPHKIIASYYTRAERDWTYRQQRSMMGIFRRMTATVPAYKKFLAEAGLPARSIRTFQDLARVPFITKAGYFNRYGLGQTAPARVFGKQGAVMTSTSGSTGQPTYFARNEQVDFQYSVLAEFFLANGPKGPTLLIDCFGMGVWIGGLITYQAFRSAAQRGWPVTILTPGINKKEIFHALRELAPQFKNVILAGYPPFIKDILDEAAHEQVQFGKFRTRLLFAAESFTEHFRDHVAKLGKVKNLYTDTLNIYGSAELGAMAFETPFSIFIRRQALRHPGIYKQLFGNNRLPTLAQYNPEFVSFSQKNGEILISADNLSPFLNYKIGDNGGVATLSSIEKIFRDHGVPLKKLAQKEKIKITTLPFVYVFERSDFSVKLYGAIIYPEHIRAALHDRLLSKCVTGKFFAVSRSDKHHNQFLEINVELSRDCKKTPRLKKHCAEIITKHLLKNNAEYKNNHHAIPAKVIPRIVLWDHEDATYFSPGIKQVWIKK